MRRQNHISGYEKAGTKTTKIIFTVTSRKNIQHIKVGRPERERKLNIAHAIVHYMHV